MPVEAEAERAAIVPKVFTQIHLKYPVAGRGLDPRQVERAVKLSKDKYCSATLMLAKTAEITYEIAIVDGDRLPRAEAPAGREYDCAQPRGWRGIGLPLVAQHADEARRVPAAAALRLHARVELVDKRGHR